MCTVGLFINSVRPQQLTHSATQQILPPFTQSTGALSHTPQAAPAAPNDEV
jgi:hypothetical protein